MARNFNDKLRREIKKHPENQNILPQFWNVQSQEFESRITIDELKSLIQTRQDYNRYINMLKRFSKRGAERIVNAPGNEYGTKTTAWQRQELGRLAGIVNRRRKVRKELLSAVEIVDTSGKLGYTAGQLLGMGLVSEQQLSPTTSFTPSQSQTDVKFKLRALTWESRDLYHSDKDKILKDNFIKTLKQNYYEKDIKEVIKKIEEMDPNLFVLKFEAKGDAFEFAYPPKDHSSEEYLGYLEELRAYWLKDIEVSDLLPVAGVMVAQ